MQVILLRKAQEDIREGHAFYARQDVQAGAHFMETVAGKLRLLESIGGVHVRVHGCFRMLAFPFPFAIYYLIRSDTVIVRAAAILIMAFPDTTGRGGTRPSPAKSVVLGKGGSGATRTEAIIRIAVRAVLDCRRSPKDHAERAK